MKSILFFGLILCYFKIDVGGEKFPPLIFSRAINKLVVLSKLHLIKTDRDDIFEMACPAKDEEEETFNTRYSFNNAALFVYMDRTVVGKDRGIRVCDKAYKLSMAFSVESGKWEFGYEIYFPKGPRSKFTPVSHENYYSLNDFKEKFLLSEKFSNKLQLKENEMWLKLSKMGFIWIPAFKIELSKLQIQNVEYEINYGNMNPLLPCEDFSLGKKLFDDVNIDLLYLDEIQRNSLQGVVLPNASSKAACNPEYNCFKKWLLIPSDQFQFLPSSLLYLDVAAVPVCSNVTTVPIWDNTIGKILQKLDQHLYSLYWVGRTILHIVAGVHGVLELQKKKISSDVNTLRASMRQFFSHKHFKPIVLERNDITIEVPNIIYKMVQMKVEKVVYGVIIIIHNDPFFRKKICDDVTEKLGWQEIKYEVLSSENQKRIESKFIYVCKISKNVLKTVGLSQEPYAKIKELSLIEFPFINEDENLDQKNINNDISNELERVSKNPNVRPRLEKDEFTYYHRPFYFH